MERKGLVTFKGNPLTLIGAELKTGSKAPEFKVISKDLKEVTLKDFTGKAKLISVTPSLDTPVCDNQARRFNQEAASLPGDVAILNISMDLPFAIGRFCSNAGIDRIQTFSDHRDASFGMNYGVLVKEIRLLARSIFVIDSNDVVRYMELVPELTSNVNFQAALDAAARLLARR
ncbi:MAG: thiol peroxidase [Deltaproteobacteria bacterium]|nr:thiol peroxidase [Deltaproteobacteria bacterium]